MDSIRHSHTCILNVPLIRVPHVLDTVWIPYIWVLVTVWIPYTRVLVTVWIPYIRVLVTVDSIHTIRVNSIHPSHAWILYVLANVWIHIHPTHACIL